MPMRNDCILDGALHVCQAELILNACYSTTTDQVSVVRKDLHIDIRLCFEFQTNRSATHIQNYDEEIEHHVGQERKKWADDDDCSFH